MPRDKINDLFESKGDSSLVNSTFMKALEDIDYDIVQMDIDAATSDELENDRFKDLDQDIEILDTPEKMEKLLSQEGLTIDDPVRMYLKEDRKSVV